LKHGLLLATLWLAVFSAAPAAGAPELSAAEQALVRQASERGRLLYAYDRAAWIGTDDMKRKLPKFAEKVGGWIVDGPAERPTLVFFDRDAADPKALYVAAFEQGKLVSGRVLEESDDRTLSAGRKRLIAARSLAVHRFSRSQIDRCSPQPFNSVVLPPETPEGPVLVYFLMPQPAADAIPFGGHFLVEVAPDGTASTPRKFTNSCLTMEMPKTKKKAKSQPAAMVVTHLLDPAPTEIHVFSSLAARYPVVVGTTVNAKLWMVDGPRIQMVRAMTD
jgi:hypothetical protein